MSETLLSNSALLLIIDSVPISILLVNKSGKIIFANSKIEVLLGYDKNELVNLNVNSLVPKRLHQSHQADINKYHTKPSTRPMNSGRMLSAVKKNGDEISVQLGLTPITIEENQCVIVSMIEAANKVLKTSSHNDQLTGLPNRFLFNEVSNTLRESAIVNNTGLALVFIDLDNFKTINDQFGHEVGDSILCRVAEVFSRNVRKNDVIGRIGGDEFVICLYGMDNNNQLSKLCNTLIKEITLIKNINGNTIYAGASVGAVILKDAAKYSIEELTNMADKLMYKAKNNNKGTVCIEEF